MGKSYTIAALVLALAGVAAACIPQEAIDTTKSYTMPSEITAGACKRAGGERGGMLGRVCVFPTVDGGKQCTDGAQCSTGECVTDDLNATTGQCKALTGPFGCGARLTNGHAKEAMCVD
jgi:hypothetical protein